MTDLEIVSKCNALAKLFYAGRGYAVEDGYRFDLAHHPQEQEAWDMACMAFELLLEVDPNDAVSNLDDDETEKEVVARCEGCGRNIRADEDYDYDPEDDISLCEQCQ